MKTMESDCVEAISNNNMLLKNIDEISKSDVDYLKLRAALLEANAANRKLIENLRLIIKKEGE
jgi:hypothetical protein